MAERMRVTSFIDTASDGRPGGVPDRDSSAVARRSSIPAGMHRVTAQFHLNRIPRKGIAAQPPWSIDATLTGGIAARRTQGLEDRKIVLRAKTTVPSGRVSRSGGPRAVRRLGLRPV